MLFVLMAITASPIANEVDALVDSCEIGVDAAKNDPAEIPNRREACRVAAVELNAAIGAVVADPEVFQDRVIGAWRVFDAAISTRGAGELEWGGGIVQHAANDVRRLKYEVAQAVAAATQP